ncbi:MAG: hypothetical protein HQM16_16685 [Deltaproteobacteria bacterium]|nr:hypothetical protein [Deltaproteobacteria bacterium]
MSSLKKIVDLDHLYSVYQYCKKKWYSPLTGTYTIQPGSDGVTFARFSAGVERHLKEIRDEILSETFQFGPFLRATVKRPLEKKTRVVWHSTIKDYIVQRAIFTSVQGGLDDHLLDNCLAYRHRRGDGTHKVQNAVDLTLRMTKKREHWALVADIHDYSESMDHAYLSNILAEHFMTQDAPLFRLYKSFIAAPCLMGGCVSERTRGIPTGGILHPFLNNVYLTPLDNEMKGLGIQYYRYSDNLIAFVNTREEAESLRKKWHDHMTVCHLGLNEGDEKIVSPDQSFVFLGYRFDGPTLKVGPRAVRRFQYKIKKATRRKDWLPLKKAWKKSQHEHTSDFAIHVLPLIDRVNRVIEGEDHATGFARYFTRAHDDRQFRELDQWIRECVRAAITGRWVKRNRRLVTADYLMNLGLRSLMAERYYWKHLWQDHNKESFHQIVRLRNIQHAANRLFFLEQHAEVPEGYLINPHGYLADMQGQLINGAYRVALPQSFNDRILWLILKEPLQRLLVKSGLTCPVGERPSRSSVISRVVHILKRRHSDNNPDVRVLKVAIKDLCGVMDLHDLEVRLAHTLGREEKLLTLLKQFIGCGLDRGQDHAGFFADFYLLPFDDDLARIKGLTCLRDDREENMILLGHAETLNTAASSIKNITDQLRLPASHVECVCLKQGEPLDLFGYRFLNAEVTITPAEIDRYKRRIRAVTQRRRWRSLDKKTMKTKEGEKILLKLIKEVNDTTGFNKYHAWARRFCRVTDFALVAALDDWTADRIRACAFKRFNITDRRRLTNSMLLGMHWRPLVRQLHYWKRRIHREYAMES